MHVKMNLINEIMIEKITIDQLVEMMERHEKVQIIDVRQADWEGGHLRGAMHIPFDKFTDEKAMELVKLLIEKKDIVFLCMHSKQPASLCASQYARMRAKYMETNRTPKQRVLILFEGMSRIMTAWFCSGTAGAIIEGYDKSMWKIQTNIGLIHTLSPRN